MDWCGAIAKDGFAILPGVFSAERVGHLLSQLGELDPRRSRAGIRHALKFAPIAEFAQQKALIDVARTILDGEAFPFRATLFDKSQGANWLVVWHQDRALPLRNRYELQGWGPWSLKDGIVYAHAPAHALSQVLTLRVSLDDSTAENGPLRVLPSTHTLGVLSDDEIHDLSSRLSPVECTVAKGGVVAMRPLVVHASSKSQTARPRRVLHVEYAASESIANPLQLAVA